MICHHSTISRLPESVDLSLIGLGRDPSWQTADEKVMSVQEECDGIPQTKICLWHAWQTSALIKLPIINVLCHCCFDEQTSCWRTCALFLKFTYTMGKILRSVVSNPYLSYLTQTMAISSWFNQAYGQSHPNVPKGELLPRSDAFPDTVSLQAWELFPFRGSESL